MASPSRPSSRPRDGASSCAELPPPSPRTSGAADVLGALARLVRLRREGGPAQPRELEIRLGRDGGREGGGASSFRPGVAREDFEQLERDMEESAELRAEDRYTELVDYHYTARRNERVRTRVTFDAERMELGREHVRKDALATALVRSSDEGCAECCRVACAREDPVAHPPEVCLPTNVRVKQRRRFLDVREGRVVWSYELSRTWSAPSRSAVEHLQHVQVPTYEVECELVDEGGAYLAAHSDEAVARSLLLKAHLLLGEDAPSV